MQMLRKTINFAYGWVRKGIIEEGMLSRVLKSEEEFAR